MSFRFLIEYLKVLMMVLDSLSSAAKQIDFESETARQAPTPGGFLIATAR